VIVAAASLPNPPLLLPGMTGGEVAEVEELRVACGGALKTLAEVNPDCIVLVGARHPAETGTPLSVCVGRSLLQQFSLSSPVGEMIIDSAAAVSVCAGVGPELAARADRVALLVMADGSARRTVKAPGYLDDRAIPFDDALTAALRTADAKALAALDPTTAAELLVAGWAAWQVLAGALATRPFTAIEHYADGPFGVWYPVFSFRPVPPH
jgi:hypothetical protein